MQLKRLEAYGFKSFADKVDIEFDKGITAIVGPNGSGKSNITDAIKWVLGEQNVRNLRGIKAEDIIFTGSASRKPMGVAEVSLFFDNDGTLPVDFQEVVITRRLFRNGDSEFYINKSRCRLKDISNLFADTGLGHDGMGIISQNRIDEVLNARPEERRLFFEEAAGITKYRNRKRESLRKLDDTDANLTRVSDIIGEIENQMEPLRLSAEKTEKYNALQGEYKQLQLTGLYHRYLKLKESISAQQLRLSESRDQELAADTSLKLIQSRKEQLDSRLLELERQLTSLATERSSVHDSVQESQKEIRVLEERNTNSIYNIRRLAEQRKSWEEDKAEAISEIERLEKEKQAKQQEQQLAAEEIEKLRAEAKKLSASLEEAKARIASVEEQHKLEGQELITCRSKLQVMVHDLEADSENRENRRQRIDELTVRASKLKVQQQELADEAEAENAEAEKLAEEIKDNQKIVRELKEQRWTFQRKQDRLNGEIQADKSRKQVMENLQHSYEGFGKAAKAVLTAEADWRSGVSGAVAELLEVPKQYVTAIEVALGGALQNIVTEDAETAKAAIGYLKAARAGRATFLPLDNIAVRPNNEKVEPDSVGLIGWADSIVSIEPRYMKIAQFLLGRTLLVDNLDNGLAIARRHNQRLRIVTLQGELISPGGALAGGSHQSRESGFLNRNEEIRELSKRIDESEKRLAGLKAEYEQIGQKLAQLTLDYNTMYDKQHKLELRKAQRELLADSTSDELTRLNKELEQLVLMADEAESTFAELHNASVRMRKYISELENKQQATEARLSEQKASYDELELDADDLSEHTRELEIKETNLRNEALGAHNQILLHKQSLTRYDSNIAENLRNEEELKAKMGDSKEIISAIQERITSLQADYEAADKRHRETYDLRMQCLADSKQNDDDAREASRRLSEIQHGIHQQELAISKVEYDIVQAEEDMLSQYGMVPERIAEAVPDIPEAELKQGMSRIERELNSIGQVNPNAPQEYADLKARHGFMAKQADDLVAAKDNILEILREMDITMTKQFKEAFVKIDEYFQDIFVRLFGGGEARVQLTDKENILESGVDISVQLPEKKRQNLSALSGGERALTVVALLFAFLKYRPAPFSVLDEIDAPLDEANISRFGKFLGEYAENTQFIIVTHRKGTMESADTMYGVTVEDSGVSKVLSVRISDADKVLANE